LVDVVAQLQNLLENNYKIQKVQPAVFASDAEVNIVIVTLACPDGSAQTVRAYREEAHRLREFIRTLKT
jgi:hypothetical protein